MIAGRINTLVAGVPAFVAPRGLLAIDTVSQDLYQNMDGTALGWVQLNISPGSTVFDKFWQTVMIDHPNQEIGIYSAGAGNIHLRGQGIYDNVTENDASVLTAIDSDGYFFRQASNLDHGIALPQEANTPFHRREYSPAINYKWKLARNTDIRFFAGLADTTIAIMTAADDPAASYVGVQFSTPRADANWQFVMDDGVTQTLVDSGIVVDTAAHFVQVFLDEDVPNATVRLMNTFGSQLAQTTFSGANLLAAATNLRGIISQLPTDGVSTNLFQYFGVGINRYVNK